MLKIKIYFLGIHFNFLVHRKCIPLCIYSMLINAKPELFSYFNDIGQFYYKIYETKLLE